MKYFLIWKVAALYQLLECCQYIHTYRQITTSIKGCTSLIFTVKIESCLQYAYVLTELWYILMSVLKLCTARIRRYLKTFTRTLLQNICMCMEVRSVGYLKPGKETVHFENKFSKKYYPCSEFSGIIGTYEV